MPSANFLYWGTFASAPSAISTPKQQLPSRQHSCVSLPPRRASTKPLEPPPNCPDSPEIAQPKFTTASHTSHSPISPPTSPASSTTIDSKEWKKPKQTFETCFQKGMKKAHDPDIEAIQLSYGIRELLHDYTDGGSAGLRFAAGHWAHKHIEEITARLNVMNSALPTLTAANATIFLEHLLFELNSSKREKGTLHDRIIFLLGKCEEKGYQPRKAAPAMPTVDATAV